MTYDIFTTKLDDAAALCGLALRHCPDDGTGISKCELLDAGGNVVFSGKRWPESWLFMEQNYGLTPSIKLPAGWYGEVTE